MAATPDPSPPTGPKLDLSRIRHDLRTPINHILGYCEMLQEEETVPADFQPDLGKVHSGGRHLLALIKEYFDEATFEEKRHDLHRLCHELRTPVNHIVGYAELLEEQAEDRGLPHLLADLRKIADAGHTWLGLMEEYLVRPIQEAGPGPAGGGPRATTTMLLQPGVDFTSPAPFSASAARTAQGHLLVADDDASNREMLARRLQRQGHRVCLASSGLEVLRLVRAQKFDLVLLDMIMPGLDGYQVLTRMKSDPALADIPVILLSSLDQENNIARCIEAGAEDYVSKPFNPVFLRARISACLEKKRLRDREVSHLRQIEAEKKRADELLHIILPHNVAEELKLTHAVKPRRFENVGVLFCDIAGFTAYCDQHPPEEVHGHLQALVETFERLAAAHGLEKIKTIGDSFMATAGLIEPLENPALACARCGLEMIEAARSLPTRWEVRVGAHVGPVIAGVVGRKKYQYDVWGDTVNTAGRMEQAAPLGAICVNAETWRRVAAHCHGQSLGCLPLKGKREQELFRIDSIRG